MKEPKRNEFSDTEQGQVDYNRKHIQWVNYMPEQERKVRSELDLIVNELAKAEVKHPNWPNDNLYKQHAIIAEELGEVAKAVLQNEELEGNFFEIQQELREAAAMCLRMLINL